MKTLKRGRGLLPWRLAGAVHVSTASWFAVAGIRAAVRYVETFGSEGVLDGLGDAYLEVLGMGVKRERRSGALPEPGLREGGSPGRSWDE